jgi:type IV pilus assembly protein PilV
MKRINMKKQNSFDKAGSISKQVAGFTLVEVMVAVLILSLGLLGVAGLQTFSLRSNRAAFYRSQATSAAYDIIDRMRANPQGVAAGNYDAVDSSQLPGDPNCISSGCSASQLADYDVLDWSDNSLSLLPDGAGTVAVDDMGTATDPSDDVFVVTISWSDTTDQASPNKNVTVRVRL